jgi:hypothetical protein
MFSSHLGIMTFACYAASYKLGFCFIFLHGSLNIADEKLEKKNEEMVMDMKTPMGAHAHTMEITIFFCK